MTAVQIAAARAACRKWYWANADRERERARERSLKRYRANREKLQAQMRERYAANPAAHQDALQAGKRRRNGLPEPSRPRPKVCECCGDPPGKRRLAFDHCHETGAFRGWLCNNCNVGLGNFGDSTEGLQRAIEYLRRAAQCGP